MKKDSKWKIGLAALVAGVLATEAYESVYKPIKLALTPTTTIERDYDQINIFDPDILQTVHVYCLSNFPDGSHLTGISHPKVNARYFAYPLPLEENYIRVIAKDKLGNIVDKELHCNLTPGRESSTIDSNFESGARTRMQNFLSALGQ